MFNFKCISLIITSYLFCPGNQELGSGKNVSTANPPDLSMAFIRNDSGLPLSYWMHDNYDGSQMDIPINSEKPLAFNESMYPISSSISTADSDVRPSLSSALSTGTMIRRIISLSVRSPDGNRVLAPIRDIHLEGNYLNIYLLNLMHAIIVILNHF